jgi:hypothetical protein
MEGSRFDDLTRTLAAAATRRGIVRGLAAGAAAAVGAALGRRPAAAKPGSDRCKIGCSSVNRTAKSACEKACRECGGDFDRVCFEEGPSGPTAFHCCPTGTFCVGEGVCCAEGTQPCSSGSGVVSCCPAGTFCNHETAECLSACPVDSGCASFLSCAPDCVCVSSVEDEPACVSVEFFGCDAPQCESSADCGEGGICVDVSDDFCCGPEGGRICIPAEARCEIGG